MGLGPLSDIRRSRRWVATNSVKPNKWFARLITQLKSPQFRFIGLLLVLYVVFASAIAVAMFIDGRMTSPTLSESASDNAKPSRTVAAVDQGAGAPSVGAARPGELSAEGKSPAAPGPNGTQGVSEPAVPPATPNAEDKSATPRPPLSARSDRAEDQAKPPERALTMEERFIATVAEPARLSQRETRVPTSVTIAQAMLESDWGRSRLSRDANNYFGIKARTKPGTAGVVQMDTWESIDGRDVILKEPFRAYRDMVDSFIDHGLYFVENARYALAMQNVANPREFARLIHKAGYATDPRYSDKLIALMDKFNLYAYDKQS